MLPLLIEKTRRLLILSGILVEQEAEVQNELKKYEIKSVKVETDGEWISLVIEKP
jgi:ribosomal protein L11 methylase PrmA